MRERSGGGVNIFNHPGYLDLVGWDRVTAAPTMSDPTLIGLSPDAAMWSWDFDGIEVMNGHGDPFADGNRRFDNWQSFLNAGESVIAVGASDDHGGGGTGFPRTYFESPTDDPTALEEGDLVAAYLEGRAIVSAGAFARVYVGDAGVGDTVTDTDSAIDLDVHIEALPEADVTHFIVFANCDEVLSVAATDPDGVVKFSDTVEVVVAGDAHITVAAFGLNYLPDGLPQYDATRTPRALTNPIYIDGDGDGAFTAPGGRECSYTLAAPAD
jgi:hypothetical protein